MLKKLRTVHGQLLLWVPVFCKLTTVAIIFIPHGIVYAVLLLLNPVILQIQDDMSSICILFRNVCLVGLSILNETAFFMFFYCLCELV